MTRLFLAGLLLGAGCSLYRPAGEGTEGLMPEDARPEPAAFRSLREAWVANNHAAHPTRATLAGVRAHDGRLPDFSPEALGARLDLLRRYRSRLDRIDRSGLDDDDRRAAEAVDARLRAEIADLETGRAWERDPDVYRAILAEGLRGLLEAPFEGPEPRVAALTARLERVPAFLAQARENLTAVPRAAAEAARISFAGLATWMEAQLPGAARTLEEETLSARFRGAQASALAAVRDFKAWMQAELRPRSDGAAAPGDAPR